MGVEEVVERTTISFYRDLSLEEVEELFRYIAKESGYEVKYTVETGKAVSNVNYGVLEETREQRVNGSISAPDVTGLFPFECYFKRNYALLCDKLKFTPNPGVSLEEYRQEEVGIWDNTRKLIAQCFSIGVISGLRQMDHASFRRKYFR